MKMSLTHAIAAVTAISASRILPAALVMVRDIPTRRASAAKDQGVVCPDRRVEAVRASGVAPERRIDQIRPVERKPGEDRSIAAPRPSAPATACHFGLDITAQEFSFVTR
mgnify:CR=1 FL=1